MSLVSNANNVNFASNFDVDKIVRIFTGSFDSATDVITRTYTFAASPLDVDFYEIPHHLGRPVFCELQWSLDNEVWLDGGVYNLSSQSSIAISNSESVFIFSPTTSGTVYYRVYCSWIDDYDSTNPLIETVSYTDNPIQFDSRVNFQKIHSQGELSFSAGTLGSQETLTATHGLGYVPNAKVWFEAFLNEVWPLNAGGLSNNFLVDDEQDECELSINLDFINVTFYRYSNTVKRAWYKIYYDAP